MSEAHLRKALHDAEKVGIAPEELEARWVLLFPTRLYSLMFHEAARSKLQDLEEKEAAQDEPLPKPGHEEQEP